MTNTVTVTVDRPTVINFFATWCQPCYVEFKEVFKPSKEYDVICLCVHETKLLDKFRDKFPYQFYLEFDYKIKTVPYSVFIDKEGKVKAVSDGKLSVEEWRENIRLITLE